MPLKTSRFQLRRNAHMLAFWRYDSVLSQAQCPDSRIIRKLANEAVFSELHLSPEKSTIIAILLNVGCRPTTSMTGNSIQLGSAVALCHSFGLNHNPLSWDIPEAEKHLRMRMWWSVLIHDRWSSLAYGTPPHIRQAHHDMPHAMPECLSQNANGSKAHQAFVALSNLTFVLDLFLDRVLWISPVGPGRGKAGRDPENVLELWMQNSLQGDIRKVIVRGTNLDIPGAANLRLAYLAVRLLQQRIRLDEARRQARLDQTERNRDTDWHKLAAQYMAARRAAEDIVLLVRKLRGPQLRDFWLPVTAFTLVSTVTMLIRCALEAEGNAIMPPDSTSLRIAEEFLSTLRSHRARFGWDLADLCLTHYLGLFEEIRSPTAVADAFRDASLDARYPFVLDTAFLDVVAPKIWETLQRM